MGGISGSVPILFTPQPAELRSKLKMDPDGFFAEINRFMSRQGFLDICLGFFLYFP